MTNQEKYISLSKDYSELQKMYNEITIMFNTAMSAAQENTTNDMVGLPDSDNGGEFIKFVIEYWVKKSVK